MTHAYLYFLSTLAGRTLVILVCLTVGFRLLGKRQLGQLNVYDLALIMALANAVQNAMTSGAGDLTVGFVCAGTLLIAGKAVTGLCIRHPKLESSLVGTPTTIIRNGELIKSCLDREGISDEHVEEALRQHGCSSPKDVALGVLEVDGSISIVMREDENEANEQPGQGQRLT
jgi:uncharacterized membrane protein YcaP (DUF421 family)